LSMLLGGSLCSDALKSPPSTMVCYLLYFETISRIMSIDSLY
jgi:hypothetical protein